MDTLGYICKKCEAPAPVGVGYTAYSPTAESESANITSCECGYSQKP